MEPVQKLYDRLKEVLAQASVAFRQGKTSRAKDLMRQVPPPRPHPCVVRSI